MKDERKTKKVLIAELAELRQRVAKLETSATKRTRAEDVPGESKLFLQDVFDAMQDGISVLDTDLNVIRANHWMEQMYVHRMPLVGRKCYQVYQQRRSSCPWCPTLRTIETGETHTEVVPYPSADDPTGWIELTTFPIKDEKAHVTSVIEYVKDITERKRTEEALRESEERLKTAGKAAYDMIYEWDVASDALEWFGDIDGLLGYREGEISRDLSAWLDLIHPDDKGRLENAVNIHRTSTAPIQYEYRVRHKDGTYRYWNDHALPLLDDTGLPYKWVGVCTDITERKRAEEALRESHERLLTILDSVDADIYVADLETYEIMFINHHMRASFGKDLVGKICWEVFRGESGPCRHCTNDQLLDADGNPVGVVAWEGQNPLTGRSYINYDRAIRWVDGRLVRLQVATDITERKQAQEERESLTAQVHEQARQMEQILATVPEGVLLLDAEGRIVLANPTAENSLAVLVDRDVISAHEPITHLSDRPLAELLTSPSTTGLRHEVKAGKHTFEVTARPIKNSHQPGDWVLVINDVTQEREVREQLERQGRLAAVGQLATGIAHDFSNVMATIVLYAQMTAQAEGLSNRDRERMATITQQAQHATRLIQQILDFSRRAVLAQQPLDLLVLLKEVAKLLERTLPEHIKIDLNCGSDEYFVRADPTRMRQMVTNLALNARDAMPLGGALRIGLERVEVKPGESPLLPEMETGSWIRLTVSDNGSGIPPDVLPHIFEPFFTTKEPSIGTGLGLAQVHGIVGQHEGRIDVETQIGGGTTFTIYLPALPHAPAVPPVPELSAMPQGRGETVLVVEDETSVRRALVESLRQLNYRVLEAENGQDALEILEQHEVSLVLSDVVMPEMGGVALFHAMKQKGSTVPMVLLTGHPMEKQLEDLKAEGLGAWLLKPPGLEQLAEVVARVLGAA